MRSGLADVAVLLVAASCTCNEAESQKPAPSPRTEPTPTYPHATIEKTCDSTGSESLLLVLASAGDGCAPVSAKRVTISIERTGVVAPASLELAGFGSAGTGRLCPEGGMPCTLAKTGKLVLEQYDEGKLARGTFELELPAEGVVRGSFDAKWCAAEACADAG